MQGVPSCSTTECHKSGCCSCYTPFWKIPLLHVLNSAYLGCAAPVVIAGRITAHILGTLECLHYISKRPVCPGVAGTQDSSTCSTYSSSDASGAMSAASTDACLYEPVQDLRPPQIIVLGDPPDHVHVKGRDLQNIITESTVPLGTVYSDPGAIALDNLDGDVSDSVSMFGLSLVSTRTPTAPGIPHAILYSAQDSSGNFAEPAERHVLVVCPDDSLTCSLPDGSSYCSLSNTKCVESTIVLLEDDTVSAPAVGLVGPEYVEIVQGQPYGACNDFIPVSMPCDRGATAHSSIEGDITWTVMACAEGYTFLKYGLQGCDLDTSIVGTYNLTFFVTHGTTQIAVHRTLRILQACHGTQLWSLFACSPGDRLNILRAILTTYFRPLAHVNVNTVVCGDDFLSKSP